jgi:hypothetical protein
VPQRLQNRVPSELVPQFGQNINPSISGLEPRTCLRLVAGTRSGRIHRFLDLILAHRIRKRPGPGLIAEIGADEQTGVEIAAFLRQEWVADSEAGKAFSFGGVQQISIALMNVRPTRLFLQQSNLAGYSHLSAAMGSTAIALLAGR